MKKAILFIAVLFVSLSAEAQDSNTARARMIYDYMLSSFSLEDATIEMVMSEAAIEIYGASPMELAAFLLVPNFSTKTKDKNGKYLAAMYNAILLESVAMGREPLSWNDFNFWMLTYLPDAEGEVWKVMLLFAQDVLEDGRIDYIYGFRQ